MTMHQSREPGRGQKRSRYFAMTIVWLAERFAHALDDRQEVKAALRHSRDRDCLVKSDPPDAVTTKIPCRSPPLGRSAARSPQVVRCFFRRLHGGDRHLRAFFFIPKLADLPARRHVIDQSPPQEDPCLPYALAQCLIDAVATARSDLREA